MITTTSDLPRIRERAAARLKAAFGSKAFTTRQGNAAGVSTMTMHRLVEDGTLDCMLRGVYRSAIGSGPASLEDRAAALLLVLPNGSAIGRRTAAWLLGVDSRSPDDRDRPIPLECVVDRRTHPALRSGVRCYQTDLHPDDIVTLGGVRCTSPVRTTVDLLRWSRPNMGLAVADALVARHHIDRALLHDCLARWPGERNVRQARQLAEWIEPLSESFGESWLRLRILEAGFPRPTVQIPVRDSRGNVRYRLDLGWPERKLAIEYDGEEHHSGAVALDADARRRRDLARRFGWNVIGVGKGEVLGHHLHLERGVGELLGLSPTIQRRRW